MRGRRAPAVTAPGADVSPRTPQGGFVELDGQEHYRIAASDLLAPFLVSLPSDTDLWMFVASGGGLTAGRVDPEGALFPYVTVDRLHDGHHHTGPLTLVRVARPGGEEVLWQPFAPRAGRRGAVERNLYKNSVGNRLVFEEVEHELGLVFRYAWAACDEFGWVRTATLENRGARPTAAVVLDGLRRLQPFGAPLALYQTASNLVDAYKRSELDPETGLGIFSLTAGITDRAEALEVLRANVAWCCGLEGHRVHLSAAAVAAFRRGQVLGEQARLDGAPGSYLVSAPVRLEPGGSVRWHLAADAGRDHLQIAALRRRLQQEPDLDGAITAALEQATQNLRRIVAGADGLQEGGHREATAHHFANVLFNTMRGGVFASEHEVQTADLAEFLQVRSTAVAARSREFLASLPPRLPVTELRAAARAAGDPDLVRLVHEYLPLYFARRHGDPSRPWNRFSIHVRDDRGRRRLYHEGNWRDIFQNWEALGLSYPAFLPHMVARFVNASTVDGFNPYRITRDGVDWEVPAPDDPWSNIGYWGDHQIVYLLRLLEALRDHEPGAIGALLAEEIFSYADVPYRLKPYREILRDPRDTIAYDEAKDGRIAARVEAQGTDGRLVPGPDGAVLRVNLLEKLLVPALSKLSNLVPDAGIWMNTQRPEWNDANNALAGGGVSVVTLCHLRRYLTFLADTVNGAAPSSLPVSAEVAAWCERVAAILAEERALLGPHPLAGRDRLGVMDRLGEAFSAYRAAVYDRGPGERRALALHKVRSLCRDALAWVDRSVAANRRDDGLYHTYNLLEFAADGGGVEVVHLQEMLEGQVAVLGSGCLGAEEALAVLRALYASRMYRADRHSFLLYPERELPGFLARNAVPEDRIEAVPLLRRMLEAGDGALVARDTGGVVRFHASFQSERDLAAALDAVGRQPRWREDAARDRTAVLAVFEAVFGHRAYTGRSGVMFAYEGLGCTYWHMVAKLLVAVQERLRQAQMADAPAAQQEGLAAMYYRVRAGLGYERTVAQYGAFPTDPYSHTPAGGGAKQPGMTGQVKEEILTRRGELGVRVEAGMVRFVPDLLEPRELLPAAGTFRCLGPDGQDQDLELAAGTVAFTLCQVPVVCGRTDGPGRVRVEFTDGSAQTTCGSSERPRS
ncbi:MAG: hypothetical protein R6X35_03920 [Candidatus Krumholzibacteriia bacterium]